MPFLLDADHCRAVPPASSVVRAEAAKSVLPWFRALLPDHRNARPVGNSLAIFSPSFTLKPSRTDTAAIEAP